MKQIILPLILITSLIANVCASESHKRMGTGNTNLYFSQFFSVEPDEARILSVAIYTYALAIAAIKYERLEKFDDREVTLDDIADKISQKEGERHLWLKAAQFLSPSESAVVSIHSNNVIVIPLKNNRGDEAEIIVSRQGDFRFTEGGHIDTVSISGQEISIPENMRPYHGFSILDIDYGIDYDVRVAFIGKNYSTASLDEGDVPSLTSPLVATLSSGLEESPIKDEADFIIRVARLSKISINDREDVNRLVDNYPGSLRFIKKVIELSYVDSIKADAVILSIAQLAADPDILLYEAMLAATRIYEVSGEEALFDKYRYIRKAHQIVIRNRQDIVVRTGNAGFVDFVAASEKSAPQHYLNLQNRDFDKVARQLSDWKYAHAPKAEQIADIDRSGAHSAEGIIAILHAEAAKMGDRDRIILALESSLGNIGSHSIRNAIEKMIKDDPSLKGRIHLLVAQEDAGNRLSRLIAERKKSIESDGLQVLKIISIIDHEHFDSFRKLQRSVGEKLTITSVDHSNLPENIRGLYHYVPLLEVLELSIARAFGETSQNIFGIPNVGGFSEINGAIVLVLLPEAEAFSKDEMVERYRMQAEFLIAA